MSDRPTIYDLEIVSFSNDLNLKLETLQEHFPDLDLLWKSSLFAVFGCTIDYPLTDKEKLLLERLKNDYRHTVSAWRCKKR